MITARGLRHHSRVPPRVFALEHADMASVKMDSSSEARLTQMVSDHFDFIWRLLRRSGLDPNDADDAAQLVFMVATRKIDKIEPGRERTFLYGTALKTAANLRRSVDRHSSEQPLSGAEPARVEGPDQRTELAQAWSLLDQLLSQLSPELSRVLALAEIEELELKEIATLENIPQGTAASRLRRARANFSALVADLGPRHPFGESDGV